MSDANKIFKLYVESKQEPQMTTDKYGTKTWNLDGKLHREDGPAIEYDDGSKEWYFNGRLHREDGPAVEYDDGSKSWYKNDKRHRIDGPAVIDVDGEKEWWVNGRYWGDDVEQWAEAALEYENIKPTQELIQQKVAQMMQQDLFA